ncbi:sulfatase [Bythopirellula polymerisocia]|uniref:Arylsulfatase n=1 Tax=Bythopirellula polymerisocia TaxID=2528003 RepID=A0A5C6CBH1_9BACT|nr:sulfatase [Bythopirellula polymerisocia]TWU20746.1 Arylsulfatase [Bythopirellula polymerisocia]
MKSSHLTAWISLSSIVGTVCFGCFGANSVIGHSPAEVQPNFVVIVVDDLGWSDLGCYGSSFYETPHIDSLAAEAVRFTNGYAACPVCSPTRASIQTGRNPARLHTTDWFGGPQPEEALRTPLSKKFRNRPLLPASYLEYLPLQEKTIAEVLRQQGYSTFFAGKWHLGNVGYYPENQGYEFNLGGNEKGSPPGGYFSPYKNPKLIDGPKGEHLPDRLANESVRFLENQGDDPFLLVLSFYSVHNPQQGRIDLIEKYQAKAANLVTAQAEFSPEGLFENRQIQNQPIYAAMMEAVDQAVGKVLTSLEELGLEENTIVLFTSDNGGLSTAEGSPTSNSPLRAGKGWLYEGGLRVPWIVKWPGSTQLGIICNEPVISDDIMPTVLELAKVQAHEKSTFDGISLVPLLKNPAVKLVRNLYWHYPHYSNQGGGPSGAVRSGKWKLIEWYEDQHLELFNLDQDIGEHHNLLRCNPKTANELHLRLVRWREEVGGQMPMSNPLYSAEEIRSR